METHPGKNSPTVDCTAPAVDPLSLPPAAPAPASVAALAPAAAPSPAATKSPHEARRGTSEYPKATMPTAPTPSAAAAAPSTAAAAPSTAAAAPSTAAAAPSTAGGPPSTTAATTPSTGADNDGSDRSVSRCGNGGCGSDSGGYGGPTGADADAAVESVENTPPAAPAPKAPMPEGASALAFGTTGGNYGETLTPEASTQAEDGAKEEEEVLTVVAADTAKGGGTVKGGDTATAEDGNTAENTDQEAMRASWVHMLTIMNNHNLTGLIGRGKGRGKEYIRFKNNIISDNHGTSLESSVIGQKVCYFFELTSLPPKLLIFVSHLTPPSLDPKFS
jgi:hypothetical protein